MVEEEQDGEKEGSMSHGEKLEVIATKLWLEQCEMVTTYRWCGW